MVETPLYGRAPQPLSPLSIREARPLLISRKVLKYYSFISFFLKIKNFAILGEWIYHSHYVDHKPEREGLWSIAMEVI
ncbi:MAG: hypothetical protein PVI90_15415 [Desulfobacteraceae bacterium]|jgi:hypothetical protein